MHLWKKCLEILYPQVCCFCNKASKNSLCPACAKKVEYIREPICKKCGKPIRYAEKEFCHDCEYGIRYYEQGRSIWLHKGPQRQSVYQFKYHNRRIYGEFYAKEMYRLFGDKLKEWEIDTIIPIPLHRKRRRSRGYNQAEIIAGQLGQLAHIRVDKKSLVRVRNTRPQKELDSRARRENLKTAFRVISDLRGASNVLLVDDIYTTGNTMNSAAKILKENGIRKVFFLTISIGQGF